MGLRKIKLGDEVKDTVTGFQGIAMARTTWLHGCDRITIQPRVDKEGKHSKPASFDEPAVVRVTKEKVKGDTRKNKTGGPQNDAVATSRN